VPQRTFFWRHLSISKSKSLPHQKTFSLISWRRKNKDTEMAWKDWTCTVSIIFGQRASSSQTILMLSLTLSLNSTHNDFIKQQQKNYYPCPIVELSEWQWHAIGCQAMRHANPRHQTNFIWRESWQKKTYPIISCSFAMRHRTPRSGEHFPVDYINY
jgi:hypothetical protein